ncbi:MAG: hypothetical protein Q4C73_12310, partial [Eubacteriales bacterium]|nr:hypothetical protein [Eubacteriales bacterium]
LPDKKHRMFIRWKNKNKYMLTSKLDACFYFYSSLNCSGRRIFLPGIAGQEASDVHPMEK